MRPIQWTIPHFSSPQSPANTDKHSISDKVKNLLHFFLTIQSRETKPCTIMSEEITIWQKYVATNIRLSCAEWREFFGDKTPAHFTIAGRVLLNREDYYRVLHTLQKRNGIALSKVL